MVDLGDQSRASPATEFAPEGSEKRCGQLLEQAMSRPGGPYHRTQCGAMQVRTAGWQPRYGGCAVVVQRGTIEGHRFFKARTAL
jgi:hypothetical protein